MAFPSDSARTKNWGTEILTDADLEGQLDILHAYFVACLNSTTGHSHDGTSNQGPKINITNLTVSSQAQGDIYYASSSSANARLGAGTAGYGLRTGGASANPSWVIPPSAGGFSNLSVSRTNATTCAITADRLVVFDTNNVGWLCTSVSVNPAITSSGANGLDTGAEGSSTWYYLWVIRKSTDGTVAGLISTSSTSPTMPSGYDQKALVSAVRNDGSSNFIDFVQTGRHYDYVVSQTAYSGTPTANVFSSVDTTSTIPSALSDRGCFIAASGSSDSPVFSNDGSVSATNNAPNKIMFGAEAGAKVQAYAEFRLITSNTVYITSHGGTACIVYTTGFKLNKLVS